ncbi:MAG: hypothetical protein JOZ32_00520 [Bryobacterales bacterium]|nr:hypothetical protein [Bryobacterales bacterium]
MGFHRLIDLGARAGHLANAIRERYPHIQTQVFDLPEVAKLYPGQSPRLLQRSPAADLPVLGGYCTIGWLPRAANGRPANSRRCCVRLVFDGRRSRASPGAFGAGARH